jgi:hypothetical protein
MRSLRSAETAEGFALIAASGILAYGFFQTVLFIEKRTLRKMRLGGH